jgi:CDP-diacylglycerol--glycerol-3-phosphate 3-phosphatidyltransferase
MNKQALIPSGISTLRLAALPLFLYFLSINATALCLLTFALAACTDLLDGYIARKLKITSKFGAYYDAATDFTLITAIFAAFTLNGYYTFWMLAFIGASFAQFVLSSLYTKKLYDPLGKYLGSALYLAIALTLAFPSAAVFTLVEVGFIVFASTSFVTRTIGLADLHRKSLLINSKAIIKHAKTQTTN